MGLNPDFVCDSLSHGEYTNLGAGTPVQWWVCAKCRKPKRWWVEAAKGVSVLNYFRGGHLDGQVYKTSDLIHANAIPLKISEYDWTPEVIVSQRTGESARVWVHRGLDH